MENNIKLKKALRRYASGDLSEQEVRDFLAYIQSSDQRKDVKKAIYSILVELDKGVYGDEDIDDELLRDSLSAIKEKIKDNVVPRTTRYWRKYISIAAVLLALTTVSYWIFQYASKGGENATQEFFEQVKPGRQAATLTLSDGRKIVLSESSGGRLASDNGVEIIKQADGEIIYKISDDEGKARGMNTLSTARGESYRIQLPEGTKVWLNAASSLTYSTHIKEESMRKVKLEGEGYFEVATLPGQLFVVETSKETVHVLGTHFNVSNYIDDRVSHVTLVEGKVRVVSSQGPEKTIKPNQQFVNDGARIRVQEVDVNEAIAWKNGEFMFDKLTLEEIMKSISRWYDIDVEVSAALKDRRIWGSISRSDDLEKVLQIIQLTDKNIKIKVDGRRVKIMK